MQPQPGGLGIHVKMKMVSNFSCELLLNDVGNDAVKSKMKLCVSRNPSVRRSWAQFHRAAREYCLTIAAKQK